MVEYTKGLHEVADGVHAWLEPDGGWGWSNAGLIVGEGESFLVDTLFDYPMTRTMLDGMERLTSSAPIVAALNTHHNGDHCYGNALLDPAVRIHATAETVHEMHDIPPQLLQQLLDDDHGSVLNDYLQHCFGAFEFRGIDLKEPDVQISDETDVVVGDRTVRLVDLGSAHTNGDAVAFVPDAGVLFAGDLLFIGGSPISWSGDLAGWITACDRMIGWDPQVVVPGHGPVTDSRGIADVRDYLGHVLAHVETSLAAGVPWLDAAKEIDLGRFAALPQSERVVVSIYQAYRRQEPTTPESTVMELFALMAAWRAAR